MKYQGGTKKLPSTDEEAQKKPSNRSNPEELMYLDADEDHLDGKDKLSEIIHTRNIQKIKFL
jgi:hypothetical protein